MKVAVKKFKSGERYVFLLGEDGVPDFWVTAYSHDFDHRFSSALIT